MNKQQKRQVMSALAQLNLADEDVLKYIKCLAQSMLYKSPAPFEDFCVDCAIFYTSDIYALSYKLKLDVDLEVWQDDFIEKASVLGLNF